MTIDAWISKSLRISLFLGISGFLYGFDNGVITPTLALRSFAEYFRHPTPAMTGAVVAMFQAGAWIGSASVGVLSDKFGRRKAISFGSAFGVLGAAVMAGATHVAMLIVGRLLVGYGVGVITGIAPVFAAEIAKTSERAKTTGLNQMMLGWGFFAALWTGYGEGKWDNPNQWRLGFALQGIPCIFLGIGVLFLHESPRWFCLKGRNEEAEKAFRGYHFDGTNEEWCDSEYYTIRVSIAEEIHAQRSLGFKELFKTAAFRKRLFVGSFVWVAAMLSGISFVQYYQATIYATLQYSESQQLLIGALNGSVGVITSSASLLYVDRIGRKKILITGSFFLTVSFTIITILAAVFPARPGMPINAAAQRGLIACVFTVTANYGMSLGPMAWILPPEVFTTELRAKANAIVQVIHYSTSIIITLCSPIGLANSGWRFYILFICTNAVCVVVFAVVYPETRGKSLEEISEIFGDVEIAYEDDPKSAEASVTLEHRDGMDRVHD